MFKLKYLAKGRMAGAVESVPVQKGFFYRSQVTGNKAGSPSAKHPYQRPYF